MAFLPSESYQKFPNIINNQSVARFAREDNCDEMRLEDAVPTQHWRDRDFVLNWVSLGLLLPTGLSEELSDDEEIFLVFAENWDSEGRHSYINRFSQMSARLKGDKLFIGRLLEFGRLEHVLRSVSSQLQVDEELQIRAAAKSAKYALFGNIMSHDERGSMARLLKEKIKRQQREYAGFLEGFLFGITSGSGSSLTLLDQGPDSGIKRLIASFLDFPIGEQLAFTLQAAARSEPSFRW